LFEQTNGYRIPLIAELAASSENTLSLGGGYATDNGPRLKANWLRPHSNRHGHILEVGTSLSDWRKEITAGYRVPHKKHPAIGRYTLDMGLSNTRTDDTFSQLRTFDIGDHRLIRKNWTRDIFLRWENEYFTIGDEKESISLLLPGLSISRTKSSGGTKPAHGNSLTFSVLGASTRLLSDVDMLSTTASAKLLKSWRERHYVLARADVGYIATPTFDKVPTSHRFFAGGDNSVRGFSYQSISPRNAENELIGGQYLTSASLEYNFYFRDHWGLAAFADVGRAFIHSSEPYRLGVGAGLRWVSPVGPLRIDVGYGVNEETQPVRVHLAIGPQL